MAYPYRHASETPVISKYFGDPVARTLDGYRNKAIPMLLKPPARVEPEAPAEMVTQAEG